jgi:DNA-binding transcriptional ArsR family regulator
VFAALAHPTRRDMLTRLSRHRLSVGELASAYSISGPAVTQHLNVLEDAGLIRREARRPQRDCVVTPDGLVAAADWIDRHRAEWNERFDLLADRLADKREQER